MADSLGDLNILVGGDISGFEESLQQLLALAQSVGTQIDAAFSGGGSSDITAQLDAVGAAAQSAGQDLTALAESSATVDEGLSGVSDEAGKTAEGLTEVQSQSAATTDAFKDMLSQGLELAGITLTIGGIVETLKSAVESFAEFERASEVLTIITGNATAAGDAMERIPALANQLGQSITSLEAAQQRFASFGVDLAQIPGLLQTISDAAVASGRNFDTVAQSFERMVSTGTLMTRGLTQAGITVNQLADAMGMSGATSAELTTAFKNLGTGADATTARIQILKAATSSIADVSEKTANDAMGSWNQLSNAMHEAAVSIGESLAVLGGASSLEPLTLIIQAIDTLLIGTITIVTEVKDALTAVIMSLIDWLTAVGQAMLDLAHGNFTKAWADLTAGGQQAWNDLKAGGQKMTDDLSANAKILDGVWGVTTADITDGAKKAAAGMNALALAAANSQNQFNAVAAAFAAGHATLSQYTTALTALNKAQVGANNGLQVAATVLLLAENAYRQIGVTAANAATNVAQTAAAVDAGQASWTQYVAALNALNKAQMEVSGGLEQVGTAIALVDVATEQLLINAKNAETTFNAVSAAYQQGSATAEQYSAALKALNTAQLAVNGGVEQFHTALLLAVDDQQKVAVAAQNAATALQAQLAVYNQTGEGLTQLIALTNKYVTAQEAANNGAISWAAANLQVSASESDAQLKLSNANTLLAQAKQLYDDGSISIGTYNKYLQQAQQAQTTLEGSTKSNAAASQTAATAHNALSTAVNGVAASFKVATGAILSQQDAVNQINQHYQDLQINLQNAQTWLSAVQGAYDSNHASAGMLVGALQGLIKAQNDLGAVTGTTTGDMAQQINTLENLAGQSNVTATAITGIGTAMTSAAGSVASAASSMIDSINSVQADAFQATQALDQLFNQGGMQGGSGTIQTQPGDVLQVPTGGVATASTIGLMFDSITVDPLALHAQVMAEIAAALANTVQANTTATTANTTSTTANTTSVTASTNALVAQIMAQVAADTPDQLLQAMDILSGDLASGTITTTDLQGQMGSLMAAVNAATASGSSDSGLLNDALTSLIDSVNGQTTATTASTVATTAAAAVTTAATSTLSNVVNTAATAVTSIVTVASSVVAAAAAVVAGSQGAAPSTTTALLNLAGAPAIISTGGPGASTSLVTPLPSGFAPTAGQGITVNVNVSGNTVVGPGGAQQLANTIMKTAIGQLRTTAGLKINV